MMLKKGLLAVVAIAAIGCSGVAPQKAVSAEPTSPALGYDIHVQAPHMMVWHAWRAIPSLLQGDFRQDPAMFTL